MTSRICFFSNLEVAACLSRDVPGGMPGSETLYLSLLFIFFQGPPGNPGIPGLPGSEGQLFASGGHSIGASTSILPMNIQG